MGPGGVEETLPQPKAFRMNELPLTMRRVAFISGFHAAKDGFRAEDDFRSHLVSRKTGLFDAQPKFRLLQGPKPLQRGGGGGISESEVSKDVVRPAHTLGP